MAGKLILVPTPIGNLEDITLRAKKILSEVDLILAEDTRTSGNLLKHLGVDKPIIAYHQHNEHRNTIGVVKRLTEGETIALVSDAGTPGISDAGFLLVRACVEADICVECLPGPTAFVPALVVSGLPCDRFYFEGFLPAKKGRSTRLNFLAQIRSTVVLYESPYRVRRTLADLRDIFGPERRASISREISKVFEETVRGSLQELCLLFEKKDARGEFVIVVAGADDGKPME